MPYWRLHYHVVRTTTKRHPWLASEHADVVEASLRRSIRDLRGIVHAVAVRPDHVHLAISMPLTAQLPRVIADAKGAASFLVRSRFQDLVEQGFRWQEEYGIVSFNERDLPRVVAYVRNQDAHHCHDNLSETLERDSEPSAP